VLVFVLVGARPAAGLERLCDSSYENCRTELLDRIRAESVEVSVAAWFFEDARFSHELIARWQAGVPIRVIADPRANQQHPVNATILDLMADAGIPMRKRVAAGIEHWKLMLFAGQGVAYFGAANFSADAFVPADPYRNYVDETIYGTDDAAIVDSFKTTYDDAWVDVVSYRNLANAPNESLTRHYETFPVHPDLNFAPASGSSSYRSRSVARYKAESERIDVIMYRITDQAHVDNVIKAFQRGVHVRLYTEQAMYRAPGYIWHSMSVDKMYAAGIPIRDRAHAGLNHQKLVLLHGQRMAVFGSSNWTSTSSDRQHEHNYFTTKPYIFEWFVDQFERKWNNANPLGALETKAFTPLPPDAPVSTSPADGAVGLGTSGVKLTWYGGPWAHLYDIYFGTSPDPPLFAANQALGPSRYTTSKQSIPLPALTHGTTYYWRVVSKTMAHLSRSGPTLSFTTAGSAPPPATDAPDVVLWTSAVPAGDIHGDWSRIADPGAAGGAALSNPERGRAKIAPAQAAPASYFEIAFSARRGLPYHLWLRMRAAGDSWSNDSVHVQFSDAVDALGTPIMRIGTSASAEPVLQDGPGGAPPQAWGWTDNGWGSAGPPIYFAADGNHVIRIQQREDGVVVDQIVLSANTYYSSPPGTRRNDSTILTASEGGGPPADGTAIIWPGTLPASQISGQWQTVIDTSAAGGRALRNANAGAAKIVPALSEPSSYFDASFNAAAGTAYHVWIRMRADGDSWSNDSVHVQFSDSLDSSGTPVVRIGTTSSMELVLQGGPGAPAPRGWGWTENGWGSAGPHVYFAASGAHTIRVQQREDGPTIDQIVISPDTYLTASPGARRDDATILDATN
jgi:phosphatidylserine/phosphatidylglycerophosphate/cardiolipin synthase-like enzyme